MSQEVSNKQDRNRGESFKQVQENYQVMRNRIQLLRNQLQKEKDTIRKHKSMTEEMIRRKVEISKISSLKNKDVAGLSQEIEQQREKNHSYRQMHKQEMNSILKAVYLVKLDEARQMKSISQQNKSLLQDRERSLKDKQRQRQREIAMQSQNAKQRYMQYWKQKLNQVYSAGQKNQMQLQMEAEQKKREMQKYQEEELQILEEINRLHHEQSDAKKEYLAALTLSSREVVEAVRNKEEQGQLQKSQRSLDKRKIDKQREWEQKISGSRVQPRYKDHKLKQQQFWSKSPHVSIMSSHDLTTPRANVDQDKLKIILKQIKRLQARQKK